MPTNPFTPGYGIMPPHIAGREDEQAIFSESLELLAASRGPRPILMIGPRGCGKTVLIEWCRERLGKLSGKIRVKQMVGSIPSDLGGIASRLIGDAGVGFRPSEATAKLNVGVARADLRFHSETANQVGIVDTLVKQCRKSPMLLVVDEAARKSPEGMGNLLELTQVINSRSNSLLLVIAGTPGTTEVLRASGATFFDRAKGMNIGLLSADESRDVIVQPLAQQGMTIEGPALVRIIEESQGFPYFLQEWGKVLFDEAQRNNRPTVLAADVDATAEKVRKSRKQTYQSRYDEWRESDIDLLAKVLRNTQDSRAQGDFTKAKLLGAVSRAMTEHEGNDANAEKFTQQILDTGCLWKPLGSPHLISGLPSFIDHMLQRDQTASS